MKKSITSFCIAALALAFAPQPAHAQPNKEAWPWKQVRLVIGVTPGSGSDQLARSLAKELSEKWSQAVIVENRPGANTILAAQAVATADPDGHTLLFAIDATITTNPHLYKNLPYDPLADFAPVAMLTSFGTVLVSNTAVGAKTLKELIDIDKAAASPLTYASIGQGSEMHLDSETLRRQTGLRLTHVPYKGIPQMTQSVVQGETQLGWIGIFTAKPLIDAGKLDAIAYTGKTRSAVLPNVPTFEELGMPGVGITVWYGLLAPARTPTAVLDRIHDDVTGILSNQKFKEANMDPKGYVPGSLGRAAFAEHIKREYVARKKLIETSGVQVE